MNDKLKILLDKINLEEEYYKYFLNGALNKIIINKKDKSWDFKIILDKTIPLDIFIILKDKTTKMFVDNEKVLSVSFDLTYNHIDYKYLRDYYKYVIDNSDIKSLKMFYENYIYYENKIIIEVLNEIEKNKFSTYIDLIKNQLNRYGFKSDIDILINKEKNDEIKREIEEETKEIKVETSEIKNNLIFGSEFENKCNYEIKDIIGEDNNVIVECYIFGTDIFESSKSNFKILTLKVSDNTDSIYCKIFSKDQNEFNSLCSKLKVGKWIKIRGYTKNDPYSHDLVLNARDIIEIPSKDVEIIDDSEVKRVELHAHTMMSQMDGITGLDLNKHTCELVSKAIKMGYRGVAITDHNGCQAFPIAYSIINDYNKKIEDPSKHFKGLYGVELTLVDDTVDIVVRPTDLNLMDSTYVVFDTETTGFNAGGKDQMIEIGAVKIKDGTIIDRFAL